METIAISSFKTHALKLINKLQKTHESFIITKRGKPVARVIPYQSNEKKAVPGKLADTLVYEDDIISPLNEEEWEACR